MNDQEIIDNAPVGAVDFVIIDGEYSYGMGDGFYGEVVLCESLAGVSFCCRTIADIKRIVELESNGAKIIKLKQAKIIKLKQELNKAKAKIKNQKTEITNLNAALKEPKS